VAFHLSLESYRALDGVMNDDPVEVDDGRRTSRVAAVQAADTSLVGFAATISMYPGSIVSWRARSGARTETPETAVRPQLLPALSLDLASLDVRVDVGERPVSGSRPSAGIANVNV
jgi:hypothetical protein